MNETYDFIIVGSGGGSLAAALIADTVGARVLVIEKSDRIGGSTAISGGVLWMPNSQAAERCGAQDSFEEGLRYFESTVGDVGPASSPERRSAFLRQGRELLGFLEGEGLSLVFCDGYPDYYDDRPGGKARGRALRAPMLSSKALGEWFPKLRQSYGWTLPINTEELGALSLAKRTWKGRVTAAKVGTRMLRQRVNGSQLLGMGAALQGRMLMAALTRRIPIWTEAPVTGFVLEAGQVRGVWVRRDDGEEVELRARRGVLLNVGGFAHNAEMRRRFDARPSSPAWSAANPGDTGELIAEAMALGAATDLLDEAIWIPVSVLPDGSLGGFHNPQDLAKPYCILVDARGNRFTNEAASYMEVGQAMRRTRTTPAWAVFDSRHRNNYAWGFAPPGLTPPNWLSSGYLRKAASVQELAQSCGIDAAGLCETVSRFNASARRGVDEDYGRGARTYDRYYADPTHRPNPALGPLERAPFYAVPIVPGDVGTFGGLMSDEHGAVLRDDGSSIPGLYATGNCTASVMGRAYPGAGASIAASFVFGYAAAKHALEIR